MAKPVRPAPCHPERRHYARELCQPCYRVWHREQRPEVYEEGRARYRQANPDRVTASSRNYARANADEIRKRRAAKRIARNASDR